MIFAECEFSGILSEIADFLGAGDIELVFVGDDEMKEINCQQRGVDKTTDVLSFPYENFGDKCLQGSVVINTDMAERVSAELGHSADDEIALLFLHGTLHVMGYDHECDNGEMRAKEEEVIAHFNLPKSLIVRNS